MLHLSYIKSLAPVVIYSIAILLFLMGLFGKGQWALLLAIFLIPLRNVIEKIQAFPLGSQMVDILILGALLGWAGTCMSRKWRVFSPSALNMVAVILVAYTFTSLLLGNSYLYNSFAINFSEDRVKDCKNFCLMPLLFIITFNYFRERKWVYRALIVMVLAIIFMDYYTVTQISWFSSLESREKIKGTFQFLGPNEVAAFYNEYTIVLIGVFAFIKRQTIKWPLLALICVNIFCILFLFSRGAYLGLFVGMCVIFLFKNRYLLIPMVLVAICWQTVLPDKVIERIKQTTNENGQLDESSLRRLNIWEQSMDLFKKNAIVGIGYGVFRNLGLDLGDTHNIYVKYLVEQGLVGFLILWSVVFCFLRIGYILYKKGEDDLSKGLGLGLMACVFVLLVNNFFGDRWSYFELSTYLWVIAGLAARMIIIAQEAKPLAQAPAAVSAPKQKKKLRYYDL